MINDPAPEPGHHAIVTDLDGTLLACDTFADSVVRLVVARPWMVPQMVMWMLRGRHWFKAMVARVSPYEFDGAAVRPEVLAILVEARAKGHAIVLATASHRTTANVVAKSLELFDAVFGSDDTVNLKGEQKAECIAAWCLKRNIAAYAYIGDSSADIPIWSKASHAIVVRPSRSLERRVQALEKSMTVIGHRPSLFRLVGRLLRPHQWSKNLLVFVPVILAQSIDWSSFARSMAMFVAFSVCASSVYVFNDIVDAQTDRQHPKKRGRPIADGSLSVLAGIAVAACLAALGLGISFAVNPVCAGLMLGYFVSNYVYSAWAKSKPLIDVIILSGMYGLRLEAGAVAADVVLSPWLLAFSLFFFVSLAFAKRYVELRRIELAGASTAAGRGYQVGDASLIEAIGPASGYVAVLVLALYMNSEQMHAIYGEGRLLWLLCPLVLYWITRVWLLAKRGVLDDDPVVFALADRASLAVAAVAGAIVAAATWIARHAC